ncbi:helix-turn-helix domain-containing protein [Arachnia propionica]|uniref:Helix-turn-helix domain-containing protein n=1 Tax=Arachnia propionica TaxID=1750 RepID=A0A3P1T2I1_9ACTN|nr:helix-turn-helix domain-containing protein [Arachnia propionica]
MSLLGHRQHPVSRRRHPARPRSGPQDASHGESQCRLPRPRHPTSNHLAAGTLQQWRTRNRLVQALGMLRAGVLIDVAAHRVGYHDPSAFRRAFKAHFGVAPSRHAAITTPRIE